MQDENWDDEDWSNEDGSTDVVECPSCGADVYEDAQQCPSCGDYIVFSTTSWSGKPLWYVLLGLAGILAVLLAWSGLMNL